MQRQERLSTTVGIRLTETQVDRLRALAVADDRRPSAVARRIIAAALDQRDTPKNTEVNVT